MLSRVMFAGSPRPGGGFPCLASYVAVSVKLLCSGVHDAPYEQDGTGLDIPNQEDEGAIYGDLNWLLWH